MIVLLISGAFVVIATVGLVTPWTYLDEKIRHGGKAALE